MLKVFILKSIFGTRFCVNQNLYLGEGVTGFSSVLLEVACYVLIKYESLKEGACREISFVG